LSLDAKIKQSKEADVIFKQSLQKFNEAEEFKEGIAAYMIACKYAVLNNTKKSLFWLEKGLKLDPIPSRKHTLADSDIDNIKDIDDFKRIINLFRPE